jgi:xanthine dehydrogenase accessory factor
VTAGSPAGSGYAADLRSREEDLRSGRQPFVVATVVRAVRPTSARPGDRALVLPDGTIEGFVGGGCAESSVRLHALRVLATGEPVMLRIIPDEDVAEELAGPEGLVTVANPCASGGTLEIFLDGSFPPPLVQVHGDGPTARALRDVGGTLGYELRPVAPGGPVLPDAAAVIVASHGRDEERVLAAALAAGVRYVGLVASRRRGAQVLAALNVTGDEARQRVHTPAGLDIGARTAQEIALSIFAQMVAERPRPDSSPAPAPRQGTAAPARAAAAGDGPQTATDPVCGMTVAVAEATPRLPHDRGVWYFCGPGCRQAFADAPVRYPARDDSD